MNEQPPEPDPEEPTTEEIEAWLRTPEGQAAMREIMQQVVDGKYQELPEELRLLAEQGLKRYHSVDVLREVKTRMHELQDRVEEVLRDGPERSVWAFLRELDEEVKGLMDLVLEVHEPHRAPLMQELMGYQRVVEELMKKHRSG